MIEVIYHWTSLSNWENIKKSKVILPMTFTEISYADYSHEIYISERVRKILTHEIYLVGIPYAPSPKSWMESGLLELLWKKTTRDVILAVSVKGTQDMFIRENTHNCPKWYLEQYDEDLFAKNLTGELSTEDDRFRMGVEDYIDSTMRLEDYEGQYEVPEVWVPVSFPISSVSKVG